MAVHSGKKKDWSCSKCGKLNSFDIQFCEFCGQARTASETSADDMGTLYADRGVICAGCGTMNAADDQFCCECGALLNNTATDSTGGLPIEKVGKGHLICSQCGAVNDGTTMFCCDCGAKLDEEAIKPELSESAPSKRTAIEQYEAPAAVSCKETVYCEYCGEINSADNQFCSACGQPLSGMPIAEKIERPMPIAEKIGRPMPIAEKIERPMPISDEVIMKKKDTVTQVKKENPFMRKPKGF